jgi:hypothetical protein
LLTHLAASRPVFHSEADFQHALAWRIHEAHPTLAVRLEYRPPLPDSRVYVDVWATDGRAALALELKYKTRRLQVTVKGEPFNLLDQSAQDLGRYDLIKDVCRLEKIAASSPAGTFTGYVVLLTNDSAYWAAPRSAGTVDAPFRVHEGRMLCGDLLWGADAGAGTIKTREGTLRVSGSYPLQWADYSSPHSGSYGRFRYLAIRVA